MGTPATATATATATASPGLPFTGEWCLRAVVEVTSRRVAFAVAVAAAVSRAKRGAAELRVPLLSAQGCTRRG